MKINKDDPAFPIRVGFNAPNHYGLSKREYIAVHLLAAIVSRSNMGSDDTASVKIDYMIELADKLLEKLSDTK